MDEIGYLKKKLISGLLFLGNIILLNYILYLKACYLLISNLDHL